MTKLNFASSDVWQVCDQNNINPDTFGQIAFRVVPSWRVCLYNSRTSISKNRSGAFVLFSPHLPNRIIARLLSVRKREQLPSGFRVSDALEYRQVFVIDPRQEFSDAQLAPLIQVGIQVIRVPGVTGAELSDHLAVLISQ
jgi:hypothetical protein